MAIGFQHGTTRLAPTTQPLTTAKRRVLVSAGLQLRLALATLIFIGAAGCGTTRWSDTSRTATEQMLLSDAIDQAVSQLDFSELAGKSVFFDDTYLKPVSDREYLVSSMRQHLLASGAILKEDREDARYVVEARAGVVGTNRNDLLFGIPAVSLPAVPGAVALPPTIPEIPFAKRTDQKGMAKVAVFAYNRETGRPVWQSGIALAKSTAKDRWFLGAGPFQQGTIYEGTKFVGDDLELPMITSGSHDEEQRPTVSVTAEMVFPEPVDANSPAVAGGSHRQVSAVMDNGVHRLPDPDPLSPYAPRDRRAQRDPRPLQAEAGKKSFFDFMPSWIGRGSTPKPGDKLR